MNIEEILFGAEETMEKSLDYFKGELRGVRTGRASSGLVEFIKVDYYGSPTDLRSLALITVPEPTQILIKPFDATSMQTIVKGIQAAGLGLNPVSDGKQVRVSIPPLSGERRTQLQHSVKHMSENAKVAIRNARRDANKHLDGLEKDKTQHVSEDELEKAKEDVQDLLKKYEKLVDDALAAKVKEIAEV